MACRLIRLSEASRLDARLRPDGLQLQGCGVRELCVLLDILSDDDLVMQRIHFVVDQRVNELNAVCQVTLVVAFRRGNDARRDEVIVSSSKL